MIKLGVTGGIGSGKSYVCNILSSVFQIPIYNCDIRARIITLCEPDVVKSLSALVPGLYNEDGELDKSLAEEVEEAINGFKEGTAKEFLS